jgi:hypothetical protein
MEKYGIQKIVQRLGGQTENSLIEKTCSYLERSKRESGVAQEEFSSKERETEVIIKFADEGNLWFDNTEFSTFLDEGAEQKVFFNSKRSTVLKINDGIFYVNWSQYLESLIIHNILFCNTKYTLLGFLRINSVIYSVVEQDYIEPTTTTNIETIRKEMIDNGFIVKKNNDYINNEIGLIVEDLHEENVLTFDDTLFFIDTVIYIK